MKKVLATLLTTLVLALGLGGVVYSYNYSDNPGCEEKYGTVQVECSTSGYNEVNTGSNNAEDTIGTAMGAVMWVVGVIAVLMIIIGGIQYATAAGDESKTAKAKKIIVGAIIGLAVAILAGVLINLVLNNIN
ncbi:pilin [Candidatus Saccharibacteria bacterium]|nr:pilin [Candidatus Saccharibacteria bacterium]